jgi:hypothetical protein
MPNDGPRVDAAERDDAEAFITSLDRGPRTYA